MAFLQLTVVEAENLVAGDDDGWSDPYCVIQIGPQRKKTKIIKKSLNPRWNETFSFTIQPKDKLLLVEVWDWDAVGRDDFLGQIQISVDDLAAGGFEITSYNLLGKKEDSSVDRGSIYLRCRVVTQQAMGKMAGNQLSVVKQRIVETLQNNREDLSLDGCGLSSCPTLLAENVSALTSLIELTLTGNQLSSLPPEIGRLQSLETFVLANNQLMGLCPEIGRLQRLETLDISGNPVQKLPPHIAGCRGLEILNASSCELVEIPEQFCLCTRLIELNLSNNQLRALPDGVGRMTRLTVLNLMFNQFADLPITIGFCVGLAKLGSGITIANNPIENPDMWKKYQIGTDHLFDYLEKRLTLYGENNIEFPEIDLPPELLQWDESTRGGKKQPYPQYGHSPQQPQRTQPINNNQQQSSQIFPQNNNNFQQNNQRPPQQQYQQPQQQVYQQPARPAQPIELTTKTVVLKNWSISAIRGDLKPKIVKLGNYISRTTDARSVNQVTIFADNMRPEVEKAKDYLSQQPPPPRPAPQGGLDKLLPLRYAAGVVVDDINLILGIVAFLKEVKRELSYIEVAYQ